jgi:hypothetical protein
MWKSSNVQKKILGITAQVPVVFEPQNPILKSRFDVFLMQTEKFQYLLNYFPL